MNGLFCFGFLINNINHYKIDWSAEWRTAARISKASKELELSAPKHVGPLEEEINCNDSR